MHVCVINNNIFDNRIICAKVFHVQSHCVRLDMKEKDWEEVL